MTTGLVIGSRRISPTALLIGLLGLAIAAALLTPQSLVERGSAGSTYSTAGSGARISFELAQRMGWRVERRLTPLDSLPGEPNVQVVVAPREALGAREVHRLLENVRGGGGLVFSIDDAREIADSLGLALKTDPNIFVHRDGCARSGSFFERRAASLPPTVYEIAWRRPPPGEVRTLAPVNSQSPRTPAAIGVRLGKGRIAAISSSEVFANEIVRVCDWGADVVVARMFEYVRPDAPARALAVFDEFHHGYGVHGGSVRAVSAYLSRTASGRFLAQALIAALILLLSAAPRPIAPADPERIARRSPLEHADALAHAYTDVAATRTATGLLISGLRRRMGRTVAADRNADNLAFLSAIERRLPESEPSIAIVRSALQSQTPLRDFIAVGEAVAKIESGLQQLAGQRRGARVSTTVQGT